MKFAFVYRALAGLVVLCAVAFAAFQWGLRQAAAPESPMVGQATPRTDPAQWGIPEGEAATRRHIRDGLKAGDVDPETGRAIVHYHDPMVPGKTFDAPAKSPFMDMMLVPRYAGADAADPGTVVVSPRIQQNLGVRTAVVEEAVLSAETGAVGTVQWNERDQAVLQARAMGFVERLHVRAVLDSVAAGAPLVTVYVPDWVAAQEEYLALRRMTGPGLDTLVDAARQRMRQVGMDEVQIADVAQSGQVRARWVLRAPLGGRVTELGVREGATVQPGMLLARIQGTGTVWVEGQVPEAESGRLQPGMAVTATAPAHPGQAFTGRVQALLPQVDAATRTRVARVALANPGERLVPGMSVQLAFAAAARPRAVVVPSEALIRTGRRTLVLLAEAGGAFRPVEVRTGLEAGDRVEVLEGLQPGQQVVLSGQFLIDSEASLRGVLARLTPPVDTSAAGQPAAAAPGTAPRHRTPAVVESVGDDAITLTHPPIAALKWPEMTMEFRWAPTQGARPPRVGEPVDVEFEMQNGDLPRITDIRPRGAAAKGAAGARP